MKLIKTLFTSALVMPLSLGAFLSTVSIDAQATAAFARATGSKCDKCHTVAFPRLTARGERFMRNGFQIKKENEGGFGLDDDADTEKDKLLNKIGEIISVTGNFDLVKLKNAETTPQLGSPNSVGFLATSTLAKNTPIWAAVDVSPSGGAELHRYLVGRTNVLETTLINFRAGTLDPTTWTSFYGHSGAIDSASSGIGAYGGGHHGGGANFSQVGPGYSQRNAMEYYGYTESLMWSAGIGNGDPAADDAADDHAHAGGDNFDKLDYWLTSRVEFGKGSSASLLWYNANGAVESNAATAAVNLRYKNLDFRSQFTIDTTQYSGDKYMKYGTTLQLDYRLANNLMAMYRYDTTGDDGNKNGTETQMTLALVMKPQQNIRLTAAYVYEQDVASSVASDGHDDHAHKISTRATGDESAAGFGNQVTLNLHYMF